MAGDPSFYYAIFKKLQASASNIFASNEEHFSPEALNDVSGGFSLRSADDVDGIKGQLSSQATMFGVPPGAYPVNSNSPVPTDSPLYVMLNASLVAGTVPDSVMIGNQAWPVMPPPFGSGTIAKFTNWLGWNAANAQPRLIDALGAWIGKGAPNDVPKTAPLTYAAMTQAPPTPWPNLKNKITPCLFVCSMPGDDGRRHKDGGTPDVQLDHVPANSWATSLIFLTNANGVTVTPGHLKPTEEYYVAAIVGNSGNTGSGRLFDGQANMFVHGRALPFNSFMGPDVALPSLGNLDPTDLSADYEQFGLRPTSYDVVGFRLNVDKVFADLVAAVTAQVDPALLANKTPAEWVRAGHPCVKVLITSGDPAGNFPPDGGAALGVGSDPRKDRHIAQHNLAYFDMTVMAQKKIQWKDFIVAQAGAGANGLVLQHSLPLDAFRVFLAIPKVAYERYIDARGSKGGGAVRGFEQVRTAPDKPFPGDTVFLQQTSPAAEIHVAPHAGQPFFGMSLGIEGDPARLKGLRQTDVAMAHTAEGGGIVGGFTLRFPASR